MLEKKFATDTARALNEDEIASVSGGCNSTTSPIGKVEIRGEESELIGADDISGC